MHVENIEISAFHEMIDYNVPQPIVNFRAVYIWCGTVAFDKIG
jgi:hypothetical protein